MLSIGTPAGGMIGATLVVVILPVHCWQGSFLACGAFTLLAAVMLFLSKESPAYLVAKGRRVEAERTAAHGLGVAVRLRPEDEGSTTVDGARERILSPSNRFLSLGSGLAFFAASVISYTFAAWTTVLLTSVGFSLPEALTASFAFNLAAVGVALATGI